MSDADKAEHLPAINVLHEWDGSSKSPVPAGTDLTFWCDDRSLARVYDLDVDCWEDITAYLVHSYPPKRISGTVELKNGEPDFTTWEKDDD